MSAVATAVTDQRPLLSHCRSIQNAKYHATTLPFPYENRAQYERAIRIPIGKEWSTKIAFQNATMPRVLVKRGTVVEPISKPLK